MRRDFTRCCLRQAEIPPSGADRAAADGSDRGAAFLTSRANDRYTWILRQSIYHGFSSGARPKRVLPVRNRRYDSVASDKAMRQPWANCSRSTYSPTLWMLFWPAPKVTVGMPWRTSQLASRTALLIRSAGVRPIL